MAKQEVLTNKKIHISYLQAPSLSKLLDYINNHNDDYPDTPILKEDIVKITKSEDTYILLYYK